MIHNKSAHPVEVKKISVRIWSLRDEIEAALNRRMKECEAAGVPLYIEDIKKFYDLNTPDNVVPLSPTESVANLMQEMAPEAQEAQEAPKAEPQEGELNKEVESLGQAEKIIAEQSSQGLETKKPNPILERPYTRSAPDLNCITYGFVLLSDINMSHILVFTKDKFLHGQSVVVEFLIPQGFTMTASVTYCHYYAMRSRIISSQKPDYRLQLKYSYSTPGERDTLRKFLVSIEPQVSGEKRSKKDSESDLVT